MVRFDDVISVPFWLVAWTSLQMIGANEYCDVETFNVTCRPDELLLMTSAFYGRLDPNSRCLKGSLGSSSEIGCRVDVLRALDTRCSGKRRCHFYVSEPFLHRLRPCPKGFLTYLKAEHDCVKAAKAPCTNGIMRLDADEGGFLQSSPDHNCKWRLAARPGRTIQLRAFVFDPTAAKITSGACYNVGLVTDGDEKQQQPLRICGDGSSGHHRRNHLLYESQSNAIELQLMTSDHLLLQYGATGCADVEPPGQATLQRRGNTVELKCASSGETWYMTCQNSAWSGGMRNCSTATPPAEREEKSWTLGNPFGASTAFPYGVLLAVAIGVALGVFIGGISLSCAIAYLKRRNAENNPYSGSTPLAPKQYQSSSRDPKDMYHVLDKNWTDSARTDLRIPAAPSLPPTLPRNFIMRNFLDTELGGGGGRHSNALPENNNLNAATVPRVPKHGGVGAVGAENENTLNKLRESRPERDDILTRDATQCNRLH